MTDSIEDAFFLETARREIDSLDDIEKVRDWAKQILSLYVKHKSVTNKLLRQK